MHRRKHRKVAELSQRQQVQKFQFRQTMVSEAQFHEKLHLHFRTGSCDGKGCKRRYHLSCMDPPLDVSLGIWLCIICTKKRLQFGVYSVSEGIESLWDVKEGVDNGKQYFVKYKNLAHVHNRWVSESDIVDSTPQGRDLISKFSKRIHKEKTIRWRQEWAEPHRLLKRRALMPPKEAESFFNSLGDKFVCCNVEWLVKWKDLGYEHATWELESSSFLCTSEAQELKRSYDNRVEAARKSSDPAKVDKVKEGVFQKLQRLPDGCPPGLDDNHLSSLNQLREFWHNSHGAVLIDDQRPLQYGGLGIPNLELMGWPLRICWHWLQKTDSDCPWEGLPVHIPRSAQALFAAAIQINIGDGEEVPFWTDRWLHGNSVAELAPNLVLAVSKRARKRYTVSQALTNRRWVTDIRGALTVQVLVEYLKIWEMVDDVTLQPGVPDQFLWRFTHSGQYSCQSAYQAFFLGAIKFGPWKRIWKSWAPLRCKFFIWLALKNRCWTADRLAKRGLPRPIICPLCYQEQETMQHLLINCVFSCEIWAIVFTNLGMQALIPQPDGKRFSGWWSGAVNQVPKEVKKGLNSLIILVAWEIWKHRNDCVFEGISPNVSVVCHSIVQEGNLWCLAGNAALSLLCVRLERVIKTILFVMSILPHISQPLLIVSTSASLSLWETKFSRLAASINVVVYNGEKDVRKSIQNLEFYEAGSVMFQVLLTHPDAVFEDIEAIEQITWETVIVDDCQNSRVSKCLEQLKWLSTNFRMVLLSSSLKENIPEYINLLSFLNPEGNGILSVSNSISFDTAGTLSMLKKKLASYVAFERKADSSKFSEYWVPAHLSTVQLELYCYTLLSNSPALRSHSKTDNVGALRNILISLRKCCDHPYLVDQMLQSSLTKGHPVTDILDIGVRSCGKLLLLDKMLQKIRIEGLRVLILSQSGGGSGNPMGDILDDFIRQRFGYESYERVERGLLLQKKQTSMNMFNDKTKGRFIFLIDSRACGPSIKLSFVDAIIIYSSDWNPVNDLRALQRVTIESQSEHVPVFRLYSSCTVEEKALILAKHDHILDSNIQNITPSLSHSLLSWGASLLFNRLEECQNPSCSSKGANDNELFMDNVALEFLTKLPKRVELSTEVDNGAISKAYLRGSFYSRDIVVVGEREGISSIDGDLPKFWAYWLSLLNGRSPCWLHISEPAQRSRRKIQNMEGQSKNTEEQLKASTEETDEARIKRRRIGEIIDSSPKSLPGKNKDTILPGNNTSSSSHQIALEDTWQELERNNLDVTQKGLHIQLKPELSKLYKLLQMPENVISLCEELLEYILKNHQISQEPKGILHAFNLAMCWRAASLLKHKVNHTESLTLAMKKLNYECSEELAEYVYGKLKILKKKFAHRAGETSKQNHTASVCNISSCEQETSEKLGNVKSSQATLIENDSHQEDTVDIWTEEMVSGESGLLSDPGTRSKECLSRDELLSRIMNKRIKLVDKAFFLRRKSIQVKQANEVSSLDRHRQKEVAKLREVCSLVVEHLRRRQNHIDQEDRDGKIKRTVEWFTMLLYAFLQHMRCQRNRLEMRQSATWTKESQLKEETLQAAKSGHLDHTFDQRLPLPDSEFAMEEFSHFREVVGSCHVHAAALSPEPLDDNSAVEIASVRSVNASEVIEEEARNIPAEVPIQGPAPQTASLSVNVICGISDGSQGDAPLVVQSLEPSGGDRRSAEHVEEGTVGSPRQGDAAMEVSTGNRSTASGSSPHFETPPPSASREATFPVSREVEAQSNLVTQCAEQSLVSSQLLQGGAEQADLSGGASTQVLQSEGQQTVSVSSNLLERAQADESQPSHQTDAPPCSVQSAELRSEEQPSIPVYDNLLKRTQPDQSQPSHQTNAPPGSVQSAELRSEGQPSIPVYNDLLERTQPDQSQPIHQTNAAPGSAQSAELFPVASMMFNHPPIDAEPLKNELHKLRLHMDTLNKVHEMKKTQLRTECSIEIEKVKRKYDLLIEEQESTHLQQKKSFDGFYDKVLRNQSLAEDFRAKFISASAAQGAARVQTPPIRRTPQSSQQIPMRPSVVGSLASPSALPSAYRPPAPRPRVQAPQADQPSLPLSPLSHPSLSSSQVVQPSPLISSHLFRATSGTLSPIPPPRGNYGVQGESAPRAPAPHLQLRPPRAHSIPPGNQQQLPTTRVEITPSALAASASPPDSHLPPLGTSAMSTLHSALPSPGSKIAARPSITAGMHPSDSTSLSLDAWLTASLGLSGDAPRATAPVTDGPEVDVVCLSDDE
ncbi:hypothetical protein U9M48_030188 [Paspalum notatum var. saurae]|uniref:Helicase protein MOM1 n=1 Tax=Paspalum notatum var. saurae TaxID=547442 RepID=A0AAQ3TZV8_PASNO